MAKRRAPSTTPPAKKPPTTDSVKRWTDRLTKAKKDYEAWEKEFDCDHLVKYYGGRQWKNVPEVEAAKKYVINMVFATVETQLPTLMFSKPKIAVEARPSRAMQADSDAAGRATLLEATLQTFVDDRNLHFTHETTLALRDAYPRFGVVEVGYTADFLDNPNADKPVLKPDSDEPLLDTDQQPILQPRKTLKAESLFVKRLDCSRPIGSPTTTGITSTTSRRTPTTRTPRA